jgi:hypothetical protein
MHKKTLLFITTFFIFTVAKGQENHSGFSVGVSVGPSFPIGKFGSRDTSNYGAGDPRSGSVAGWAKTGPAVNISVGYRLNPSFRFILMFGGQENKQDEGTFEKTVYTYRASDSVAGNTERWKIGKIMAGGAFSLPISVSGRLFFQVKALAGLCKTAVPAHKYAIFDTEASSGMWDSPFYIGGGSLTKTPLPWTFCFQISPGLKYFLTQKVAVFMDAAYFDARPVLKQTYYANMPDRDPIPVKKRFALTSVNPLVGIAWEF